METLTLFTPDEIRNFLIFFSALIPLWILHRLERYKFELSKIQKAEKIAELFSYVPIMIAGDMNKEDIRKFNQLSNELALYLPRGLVCEISETLCNEDRLPKYKDCLVRVRTYMFHPKKAWCYGLFERIFKRWKNGDGLEGVNISHMIFSPKPIGNSGDDAPKNTPDQKSPEKLGSE